MPTELVAPYTIVMTAIVAAVSAPTVRDLRPDQFTGWRWLAFGVLIAATILLVAIGALRKGATRHVPVYEILAAVSAAAGWALVMPASPLTPYLSDAEQKFVPPLIGFVGVALAAVFAAALRSPSKEGKKQQDAGAQENAALAGGGGR